MNLNIIPFDKFIARPHDLWNNRWLLLTCGDYSEKTFNTMTVAWGSMGTMWNKPFVQVVVRPSRYTYQFMEKYKTFTLCVFPEKHRDALQLLGSRSGRDSDKIRESGLTPIACQKIDAPGFAEAELIIECRKIYFDDMAADHFLDSDITSHYPEKDHHRIYFGEIIRVSGIEGYGQ
jgi:flavin reductase (DIM6/NTAB) family NADH-FMN oxidoreductase RutF